VGRAHQRCPLGAADQDRQRLTIRATASLARECVDCLNEEPVMGQENSVENKAAELLRLHQDPTLLTVVNVWDSITAKVVAETPGTAALATASHSIAASLGYPDGEQIPVDLMIEAVGRIVRATTLPVTADLEGGYGDPADTVRKAIGVGVVGANVEDQMKPLDEAAANVTAIMDAVISEGVPDFVLNARTDAFVRGRDRDQAEVLSDAIERGEAYLEAGAPLVFVPGLLNEEQISALVEAFGPQRLTVIGFPGSTPLDRLEELGVARISYGPQPLRVTLTALQELVEDIHRGGGIPVSTRQKLA
jgi:2-methylisocitrate lyase-like PEP mutase family enzyme